MSFKRVAPTWLDRIYAGRKTGLATLLGLYTVLGAVLPFANLGTAYVITSLGAVPIVAGASAYLRGRFEMISPMLIDELAKENKYTCRPCTSSNLKLACDIGRPLFGPEHIEWSVLEQWRLKNPQGFMQIENDQGALTACFGIWGLRPNFATELMAGTVVEGQITGDTILSMKDTRKEPKIYISGVVVRNPGSYLGSKRARIMLWCMVKYIRHHFAFNTRLYSIAINRQAEDLLKSFGFTICTPAARRRDRHDCFEIDFTKERYERALMLIGDLRKLCHIYYV